VNIFVGNLAFTTTEQDLCQLFEPYGTVETVRIMHDREAGRSRGFGFVEMPDHRAAQTAIDALNSTSLAGRALTVMDTRHALRGPQAFPPGQASCPHRIPCVERCAAPPACHP
jgi:RNA recognition motif-containing protein